MGDLLLNASYVVLWGLVLCQMLALLALYRYLGQALRTGTAAGRASEGPRVGVTLRPRQSLTLSDSVTTIPLPGRACLMFFVSTTCTPCRELQPELLLTSAEAGRKDTDVVVLCAGSSKRDVADWAASLAQSLTVIPDVGERLAASYNVAVTPFCVGVDRNGQVRLKGLVNAGGGTQQALDDLLEQDEGELHRLNSKSALVSSGPMDGRMRQ